MDELTPIIKDENRKTNYIQIVFLIFLFLALGGIIFTTITLLKNKQMLQSPLGYNMGRYNLSLCTCYDQNQKIIIITSQFYNDSFKEYVPKPENNINYSTFGKYLYVNLDEVNSTNATIIVK